MQRPIERGDYTTQSKKLSDIEAFSLHFRTRLFYCQGCDEHLREGVGLDVVKINRSISSMEM
jgi:hypothetical protein